MFERWIEYTRDATDGCSLINMIALVAVQTFSSIMNQSLQFCHTFKCACNHGLSVLENEHNKKAQQYRLQQKVAPLRTMPIIGTMNILVRNYPHYSSPALFQLYRFNT